MTIVYDKSIGLQEYLSFDHSTTGNRTGSLNKLKGAVRETIEGPNNLDLTLLFHLFQDWAPLTDLTKCVFHIVDGHSLHKFCVR